MSGSTATVYLGHEAKLPHRTIRRGLLWSTSVVVVVFLLVSYAMTIGWGASRMAGFAASNIPGLLVIQHFLGTPAEIVVAVFMANSIASAIVASTLVVSRVAYAMGACGLLPASVARVDPRSGSPRVAVALTFAVAALGAVIASVAAGLATAFLVLILIGTMGEFVGHILSNAVLPAFARKRGITRKLTHVVLPLTSLATTVLGIYYTFYPVAFPTLWGPIVLFGGLVLGAAYYVARHRSASADIRSDRARLIATSGLDIDQAVRTTPILVSPQSEPATLPDHT